MEKLEERLRESFLFRAFPLQVLLRDILPRGQTQEISRGKYIIMPQERVDRLGILLEGKVLISHISPSGELSLMDALEPPEVLGADLACTKSRISPHHAMAAARSRIFYFPADLLLRPGTVEEAYRLEGLNRLLLLVARDNMKKEYRLAILSQRGLRERVMTYLTMQANKLGSTEVTIPFSREELAAFLCVNRSALSHELSLMQKEGLIRFRKNTFLLVGWEPTA